MPFFSIGVPTYNRHDLLKQTLLSIIMQSFSDFEVIVGNDYTKEVITAKDLDIDDTRIRFVNHPENLGEIGNMNSLLEMSSGRYFTWQFDDDLFAPNFLDSVHEALKKFDYPTCVYTSYGYIWGTSFPKFTTTSVRDARLYSGREFLRRYLSGKLKAVGCCGVFRKEELKRLGSVEPLCDGGVGIHSEFLLLVRAGLLEKVVYIDTPMVFSRDYYGTYSGTNIDTERYKIAGRNLVRESIKVLVKTELKPDFQENLLAIIKIAINFFIVRFVLKNGYMDKGELREYLRSIKEQFGILSGTEQYNLAMDSLDIINKSRWSIPMMKGIIKRSSPPIIDVFLRKLRSFMSRHKFSNI